MISLSVFHQSLWNLFSQKKRRGTHCIPFHLLILRFSAAQYYHHTLGQETTMDRRPGTAESPGPASVATMGPMVIRTARMSASAAFNEPQGFAASMPLRRSERAQNLVMPLATIMEEGGVLAGSPWDVASHAHFQPSSGASQGARASRRRDDEMLFTVSPLDTSPASTDSASVRRGTRKRKTRELLSLSPEDPPSRKRKPAPESSSSKLASRKKAPARLKTDPDEETDATSENNCCICMEEPEPGDLATINGCDHLFCFGCIEKWADRENSCPLCKKRFVKIERVHKPKRQKGVRAPKTSVKVKNKSQRSEMTHSLALEGLFGDLSRSGIAFESFFGELNILYCEVGCVAHSNNLSPSFMAQRAWEAIEASTRRLHESLSVDSAADLK